MRIKITKSLVLPAQILETESIPEALKEWSKRRTLETVNQGRSALFQEDREFVEEFLRDFKKHYPDLKSGFLKNRFLRYKFLNAYKERHEKEENRVNPEEVARMFRKAREKLKR